MPKQPDEQRRIDLLQAELWDIGLEWNEQYHLIDAGPKWELDFIDSITPEQQSRALELLKMIMNREY